MRYPSRPRRPAPALPRDVRLIVTALVAALLAACWGSAAAAENVLAHGLWVWKAPSIASAPRGAETLRDFCQSEGIDEVYVSVSERGDMSGIERLSHLIELLHQSDIRVEALLSSDNADEAQMDEAARRALAFSRYRFAASKRIFLSSKVGLRWFSKLLIVSPRIS